MSGSSLSAAYFNGIFEADEDPWTLASSDYEAAKFKHTHDALADRRYRRALEIGCAHGVLTGHLVGLCDTLLAIDISSKALDRARTRVGDRPGLTLKLMAFPRDAPDGAPFDLVIVSEVAYYWSLADLDRAAQWLRDHVATAGRVILVHYTGETDYPASGDQAVEVLWSGLSETYSIMTAKRRDRYRLDLWQKR